jgi:transposase-like protein
MIYVRKSVSHGPLAPLQHPIHFPDDIRNMIYTTNAIESNNSIIRKTLKRKGFPIDDSAKKI